MSQCINCGKSPLFQLIFKGEYVNRFCMGCTLEISSNEDECPRVIYCEHCKKCNEQFKKNISPMFEGLISNDVVKNVLMDYIEL